MLFITNYLPDTGNSTFTDFKALKFQVYVGGLYNTPLVNFTMQPPASEWTVGENGQFEKGLQTIKLYFDSSDTFHIELTGYDTNSAVKKMKASVPYSEIIFPDREWGLKIDPNNQVDLTADYVYLDINGNPV